MRRIILTISIALCCYGPSLTAHGQKPQTDSLEIFKQLLALPAPTPRSAASPESEEAKRRGADFYNADKAPPDDAPLNDLVDYWTRWSGPSSSAGPTATVKQRLLEACVDDPEQLIQFLKVLPDTEAAKTKVKQLYDQGLNDEKLDKDWRDQVKRWLVLNSNYFTDELREEANGVKDEEKWGGSVANSAALVALARFDWPTAEPLLQNLAQSGQLRAAALALSLSYGHAITTQDGSAEERYRNQLKAIAANPNQPGDARDTAVSVLASTEWSGRNEWYVNLFRDETLIDISDGSHVYSPLCTLVYSAPDKWIPTLARMTESKDFVLRSAAASCLVKFQNQSARKDALQPLLPWLSNPGWAKDRLDHRLRLIQSMNVVNLPESVPGLISIVENSDSDSFQRSYAADVLATYEDPRAAPTLKRALAQEKDEDHRRRIIHGLIACQGLTEDEQLQALEAYAARFNTPEGREELTSYRISDQALPLAISIGKYLGEQKQAPEVLVQAVLRRADNLKETNAPLAQTLLEVAHRWQSRQIELDMLRRIANGSADANTIVRALERRQKLRESLGPELQSLLAADGPAQGIGTVLLEDASLAHDVLTAADQSAQIALLTCARLIQAPLPVELVGRLLSSKNSLLNLAAERYLLAEDSKEARELLWKRHPNEAFVAGWRESLSYIGTLEAMAKEEEKLRAELFKENGPTEIIAVLPDADYYAHVLRIYPDRAVYTHYEDPARYRERTITRAELASFKELVTSLGFEDSPPEFAWCHHTCASEEILRVTKERGRRVFSYQAFGNSDTLRQQLNSLGQGEGAKIHYKLEQDIKDLEIVYADNRLAVRDVWQRGNELRILVERLLTSEVYKELMASGSVDEENDQLTPAERRRNATERDQARYSWRLLANNKAGAVTTQPEIYSTNYDTRFPREEDDYSLNESEFQRVGDSLIIARNFEGLWKQLPGTKAVRISGEKGAYAGPIATPDGKWIVVAKSDSDWSKPNYMVRFDLRTGREFRVNVEPADNLGAVMYLAPHNKILLSRSKDDEELSREKGVGPVRPEHYLLDANTGETRLVTGVFEPLHDIQGNKRFLQATDKPNEFWAAIPDDRKGQTQIGRYNLKDFSFKPVLVIPHLVFNSSSLWVDAGQRKIYIVYNDHLLRLPLPPPTP